MSLIDYNATAAKIVALRDGTVHLSVCLFVCRNDRVAAVTKGVPYVSSAV